jgi:hypothetical protein
MTVQESEKELLRLVSKGQVHYPNGSSHSAWALFANELHQRGWIKYNEITERLEITQRGIDHLEQ